jgi:hypothetical protein
MIPAGSSEEYYIGFAHTRGGPVDFANNWLMLPVLVVVRLVSSSPSQAAAFELVHVSGPVLTGYGILDNEIIVNPCQIAGVDADQDSLYLSLTVGDRHNPVVRVRGVGAYVQGIIKQDKSARAGGRSDGAVPVGHWQSEVQRSLKAFTAQYLEGSTE